MLDTMVEVETPEGVSLELRVAGPMVRAWAYLVDLVLRAAVLIAIAMPLGVLGEFGGGLFLITFFCLEWLYPVLFEVYWAGCTPGKRMLGLQVVHNDGTPVDLGSSLIRNLLRAADLMPLFLGAVGFYAVGFLSMLVTPGFQRLGDLAAGTLTIYGRPDRRRIMALRDASPVSPPVSLSVAEQRAIIAFAHREETLTAERVRELAELALPLLEEDGRPPTEPVQPLRNMAAYLLGRRHAAPGPVAGRRAAVGGGR